MQHGNSRFSQRKCLTVCLSESIVVNMKRERLIAIHREAVTHMTTKDLVEVIEEFKHGSPAYVAIIDEIYSRMES